MRSLLGCPIIADQPLSALYNASFTHASVPVLMFAESSKRGSASPCHGASFSPLRLVPRKSSVRVRVITPLAGTVLFAVSWIPSRLQT